MARIPVLKTVKLFINGEFPRTESGRTMPAMDSSGKTFAQLCKASRKDLKSAVDAARGAFGSWSGKTAYNRGQILYRMAEMMESRRTEFLENLTLSLGLSKSEAESELDLAIDALVYYAGFTDKYQQVWGAVNPVSGPHHNFTSPEPMGVVVIVGEDKLHFSRMMAEVAAVISSGNTTIALLPNIGGAMLAPIAEALATSDLTKGVVNLLTCELQELAEHLAKHMEVVGISYQRKELGTRKTFDVFGADNMKRIHGPTEDALTLKNILNFVEFKTVWHPIGTSSSADGGKY
jgi:acyl-CoA reductase-like NAD-dependent aldehyde dehydrogenase